jgi:hypothetical protein
MRRAFPFIKHLKLRRLVKCLIIPPQPENSATIMILTVAAAG